MTWAKRAAISIGLVLGVSATAGADQWNDRTTLTFDAPVMVPGATLGPGSYRFELLDSKVNRHVVQVFDKESGQLMATTQAIPIKRQEPSGDVVLKLNPTEAGAPIALKAWFYPGSLYGHQFVYEEAQAREIAQRTKTLVLSGDVRNSDLKKGTLYTYDATGSRQPWRLDEPTRKEWDTWSETRPSESAASVIRSNPAGMPVTIGDLEENARTYIGQTINVTGEVEEVFGPRLFKIDEADWGDLDGEILVYFPSSQAALVKEDDRVTITGTMKMFVKTELERELGWLEPDPDVRIEFGDRPVLLASRIVGGNSDRAIVSGVDRGRSSDGDAAARSQRSRADNTAVGTSGIPSRTESRGMLMDASALGNADQTSIGQQVDLERVTVTRASTAHGFWIESGGADVFVLPAQHAAGAAMPAAGTSIGLEGIVLQMPRSMRDKARAAAGSNEQIYVYATRVQ
jgi:hypothetical protein